MKSKSFQVIVLLALIASFIPANAGALVTPPPVDMFQLPWEQGLAWVSFDGLDNGTKRASTSPHNYKMGGAVDFAPQANMQIGMDTSNFWVAAAAAGTVYEISSCHIKLDHGNGWTTEYWHLANIQVSLGSKVSRNQRLGIIANNATQQVCTGNEFAGPHLHFVMRPNVRETVFAGWNVNFNILTNKTTFTKNGLTVQRLQPILNVPNLQIADRGALAWDTSYTGTLDPYRHERWLLVLTEPTKFDITVNPVNVGLIPAIVLLDSNGNEISRANGVLSSTQPPGAYFVQIQSDSGTGFYSIIATRDGSVVPTVTPTATITSTSTATPTSTGTPVVTGTPTVTETPTSTSIVIETPTMTGTPIITDTPMVTETPTVTSTPIVTDTATATAIPVITETPFVTDTPLITETPFVTETPVLTGTPILTETPFVTSTSEVTNTPGTPVVTETPILTNTPPVTGTATLPSTPTPTNTSLPSGPYVLTDANPQSLIVGETGLVTVSLNNVPPEGYSSTEFTCTYDQNLIEVSNIAVAGLFGTTPVSALQGPQSGSFILAIAGSNGNRATTSGAAFTFNARGLQSGQTIVECRARVSTGNGTLENILYIPDTLTIFGNALTATPPAAPLISGQVFASKQVTIRLFNPDTTLAATATANADGTFSLTAPAGVYTVIASAPGFLNAQGSATLINGNNTIMPIVSLPAGDIDGNGVIDQFDALTIGMNYNASSPAVADLNNDGIINVLDLELLAANYRRSGALAWQ
ncbi:MAG: peptidoglycan DD-metalloendopeptidase family protein [Anaerolineales bacterium]|nr:peptidoglycan DD-metalloendopeptidase family protein [Anaerolineales bacterium]